MDIIMPKVGDAMTEGKVVRWYKKAGEAVAKGEPVLEIETDKVNLDLEAESDGTLADTSAAEGTMVPVGEVVGRIAAPGETLPPAAAKSTAPGKEAAATGAAQKKDPSESDADATQPQRRTTDRKETFKHTTGEYVEAIETRGPRRDRTSAPSPSGSAPASRSAAGHPQDRRPSSPLARRMARDLGVTLDSVRGSGPGGRIVARDVQGLAGSSPRSADPAPRKLQLAPAIALEERSVPLSAMRRTIARRLAESTGPIPHFYLTADYDVTDLLSLREQLMAIEGEKISLNDFIVRAAALAILRHPNVNASWGDEAIAEHGEVHIGIAVSTPEGLITPVVRNADQKDVAEIAREVRALADKAKNRKLLPSEYQGSTFTISNLGAWGIEEFTAIINPPNSAILAIGAAEARPVAIDRQIVVRDRMKVTMSCDHRVIDGAAGADFLKTLRLLIEQPLRLVR